MHALIMIMRTLKVMSILSISTKMMIIIISISIIVMIMIKTC